ncbi:MAG TPA: hypothetical protein DCS07_17345 [Bdellovibrionales bacterium]|nr:MAG: hypothetical protein A2X97_03390 [Bdellovibrionales bacterium GWA1_52_35]OFZ37935.1 MAG: hypothetical protein A2070_12915 [Bdellovibrionales bacterium GWC1_52_8]HAR44366.1 hypothetical protein [Bdellovibrionales bacterium]HCM40340.1 hypothetical protein [Bdellovibrionales bacterium]
MLRSIFSVVVIAGMMLSLGCKGTTNSIIDHVNFKIGDNLETARVSVVFKDTVQSNMLGSFPLKDYGSIFITPFAAGTQPLELGFELNTKDVMNDWEYAQITPTESLPNGLPMGLGYPLVEIRAAQPISDSFDLYAYVDVMHAKWLGAAAMFKFMNDSSFPAGMAISMGFNPDAEGKPGILTSIYGPVLDNSGALIRNGGMIVLANVRQMMSKDEYTPGREYQFRPKKKFRKGGPGVLLQ